MTNKKIFCRSDPVDQERCSRIFGKTYWKTLVQMPFSIKVSGFRPATLFEERLMQRFFFCDIFKTLQNSFFI